MEQLTAKFFQCRKCPPVSKLEESTWKNKAATIENTKWRSENTFWR